MVVIDALLVVQEKLVITERALREVTSSVLTAADQLSEVEFRLARCEGECASLRDRLEHRYRSLDNKVTQMQADNLDRSVQLQDLVHLEVGRLREEVRDAHNDTTVLTDVVNRRVDALPELTALAVQRLLDDTLVLPHPM